MAVLIDLASRRQSIDERRRRITEERRRIQYARAWLAAYQRARRKATPAELRELTRITAHACAYPDSPCTSRRATTSSHGGSLLLTKGR